MKTPKITEAIGNIDEDLISGAVTYQGNKRKKLFIKWGSVAACLAITAIALSLILPLLTPNEHTEEGTRIDMQSILQRKKNTVIEGSECAIEWPWEYKTTYEKFTAVSIGSTEYTSRAQEIDEGMLGESLGKCPTRGTDSYTQQTYTEALEVRKINKIDKDRLVAVGIDGKYYVYYNQNAKMPSTLGELLDLYSLDVTLPLSTFSVYENGREAKHCRISDDTYIWQILSECRTAAACPEDIEWQKSGRNYLSFTATSQYLGIYKRVFYITEDGFVATNIFDYQYVYFIGEEAADKIISHTKSHAEDIIPEPYEYHLAGILKEIGDGYVLIDDTSLCADKNEGIVFKVFSEDLRLRRTYEYGGIKAGDLVVVKFRGVIHPHEYSITGAHDMQKGFLMDGGIAVPE